jgi:hypothetical protein
MEHVHGHEDKKLALTNAKMDDKTAWDIAMAAKNTNESKNHEISDDFCRNFNSVSPTMLVFVAPIS